MSQVVAGFPDREAEPAVCKPGTLSWPGPLCRNGWTHVEISRLRTGGRGWKCLVWRCPGRGREGRDGGQEKGLRLRSVSCFSERW